MKQSPCCEVEAPSSHPESEGGRKKKRRDWGLFKRRCRSTFPYTNTNRDRTLKLSREPRGNASTLILLNREYISIANFHIILFLVSLKWKFNKIDFKIAPYRIFLPVIVFPKSLYKDFSLTWKSFYLQVTSERIFISAWWYVRLRLILLQIPEI